MAEASNVLPKSVGTQRQILQDHRAPSGRICGSPRFDSPETLTTSADCDRSFGSAANSVLSAQDRILFRDNSFGAVRFPLNALAFP